MDHKAFRLRSQPEADWDDERTLEQLYRRHAPWLNARLRRRFGPALDADADDLVHDTYAKLGPRAGDLREPRAMLMRVASNLAKDLLRRQAVRSRYAADGGVSPSSSLAMLDACDALTAKELILSLPESYRDVFVLSRFHGMTHDEIARCCGLSVKSVEWRLKKAIAHCVKRLKD
jgi:RNA polymerase sigma-70 factor (ECF subfamily)